MITDTWLNPIFNVILEGPAEGKEDAPDFNEGCNREVALSQEKCTWTPTVRSRMMLWVSQEGQTHSVATVTQLVCCAQGVSGKAMTATAALTEDPESTQIAANPTTHFQRLQLTKTARG